MREGGDRPLTTGDEQPLDGVVVGVGGLGEGACRDGVDGTCSEAIIEEAAGSCEVEFGLHFGGDLVEATLSAGKALARTRRLGQVLRGEGQEAVHNSGSWVEEGRTNILLKDGLEYGEERGQEEGENTWEERHTI